MRKSLMHITAKLDPCALVSFFETWRVMLYLLVPCSSGAHARARDSQASSIKRNLQCMIELRVMWICVPFA